MASQLPTAQKAAPSDLAPASVVDELRCPILCSLMLDPVLAEDGHTYERAAISEWISACKDQQPTSPLTGLPLKSRVLFANHALRRTIAQLVERHPELNEQMTSPADVASIVKHKIAPAEAVLVLRSEDESSAREPRDAVRASAPFMSAATLDALGRQERERGRGRLSNATSTAGISGSAASPPLAAPAPQPEPAPETAQASSYAVAPGASIALVSRFSTLARAEQLSLLQPDANGNYLARDMQDCAETRLQCFSVMRLSAQLVQSAETRPRASAFLLVGGTEGAVQCLALEPDRSQLRPVALAGALPHAHRELVCAVASWSPSGAFQLAGGCPLVVTGSRDSTLKVFMASTPEPVLASTIASGSASGTASMRKQSSSAGAPTLSWTFSERSVLRGHNGFVNACDVEAGSGALLSGGEDWRCCLWDLQRPDIGSVTDYELHSRAVRCCAWSSSGDRAVSALALQPSNGVGLGLGGVFASGGEDEMAYVVDPRSPSGRPVARLNAGAIVLSVAWGPSEHAMGSLPWLAVGGGTPPSSFNASSDNLGGFIRLYDPRTWKAVGDCSSFRATPLRDQLMDAGQFGDADPRQLAEMAAAALRKYSSSSAAERRACDGDQDKTREAHRTWVSHLAPARLVDGTVALASSGGDAFLRLWKLPLGPGGVLAPVLFQNIPTPEMSTCNSFAII